MSRNIHAHTPEVTVLDNRGLTVRTIRYCRHPDTPDVTDERITRHQFDARGQLIHSIDPRLFALQQKDKTVKPNVSYLTNLSGDVMRSESTDAGTTVSLSDIAGRPHWSKNAVGMIQTWQYEAPALPGRLLSVTEQPQGESARITERFIYAGHSEKEKTDNLAGQAVRHYDTAGLTQTDSIALTGTPLAVTQRFLPESAQADWRGTQESDWQAALSADTFTSHSTADATGATLTHTDTKGHQQRLAYDVAGLLTSSWLTLKGQQEQTILKSLTWSAAGQKQREEHGNGVVTTYTYEPETQRLTAIKTERPAGHPSGTKVLQDLRYTYDPVGNVLRIVDKAEATRFWRNQKVVPENTYTYDSLYQLVKATGREKADIKNQGITPTSVSIPLATDNTAYTAWTRNYRYDTGNNLTRIQHHAPASGNTYTTEITVSHRSNRAVLSKLTTDPTKVDSLFDAGGHQTQLQPGQPLTWTARGELLKVMPVVRDGQAADAESYHYDANSQRVIKTTVQQTGNSRQTQRVRYLPNLELRTTHRGETLKEALQVITVGEAGRAQVRVLHWEAGKPDGINNNQLRYSYNNLIGSSTLELDDVGEIISLEEYYPYGGTALWSTRNQIEADYKTRRYSGKERDATRLYYYGYRYYQPWVGRWLSADPAGTVDGLNLFRMVWNNPVNYLDENGKVGVNAYLSYSNGALNNIISNKELTPDSLKEKIESRSNNYIPRIGDFAGLVILERMKNSGKYTYTPNLVMEFLGGVQNIGGQAYSKGYSEAEMKITTRKNPFSLPFHKMIKLINSKIDGIKINFNLSAKNHSTIATLINSSERRITDKSGVFISKNKFNSNLIGVPYTASAKPYSIPLIYDQEGNEILYRTMSTTNFDSLKENKKLPGTTETSASPSLLYSDKYSGITTQLVLSRGTISSLKEIGVTQNEGAAKIFVDMQSIAKVNNWADSNASFKTEGNQMTIQLGKEGGAALNILNNNMIAFFEVNKNQITKRISYGG